MPVMDMHCDVLMKLARNQEIHFKSSPMLDVALDRMWMDPWSFQCFAIFLPSEQKDADIRDVLRMIHLFRTEIAAQPEVTWIRTRQDAANLTSRQGLGAMLSIEGLDALHGDLEWLYTLYALGVRAAGFTWNHANWAADGIMEPRGGGLTEKGRELVQVCNEIGILIDVSHLSVKAFWDVMALSSRPVMASHSNVKSRCAHPRNLDDDQIQALIEQDGRLGLSFVPYFLRDNGEADMKDILKHVEAVLLLGGEEQLCFGSDFDGIEQWTIGMEHIGRYPYLRESMLAEFGERITENILWRNMHRFLQTELPSE
ncbi:dipeptidase [Marinicrinis sediminis]|uniref:Dipeptidase n=1 Tax=Marinicrinis sediminis TaxID=1652465 RepID=A0ABW5R4N1_9BACL